MFPQSLQQLLTQYAAIVDKAMKGEINGQDAMLQAKTLRATDALGTEWGVDINAHPSSPKFVRFNRMGDSTPADPREFAEASLPQTNSPSPWDQAVQAPTSPVVTPPVFQPSAPAFPTTAPSFPSQVVTPVEQAPAKEPKERRKMPKMPSARKLSGMSPRARTIGFAVVAIVLLLGYMAMSKKTASNTATTTTTTVATSDSSSTSVPTTDPNSTTVTTDPTQTTAPTTAPSTPSGLIPVKSVRVYDGVPGKQVPFTVKVADPGVTAVWVLATSAPPSEATFIYGLPAGEAIAADTAPVGIIAANPTSPAATMVLVRVNPATGEATFIISGPDRFVLDVMAIVK